MPGFPDSGKTAATIAQVNDGLSDLLLIAGSEAYQASLGMYSNLAAQAARNIGNAKTLHEELRRRFPRHRNAGVETVAA
jgi:hypothetical protein